MSGSTQMRRAQPSPKNLRCKVHLTNPEPTSTNQETNMKADYQLSRLERITCIAGKIQAYYYNFFYGYGDTVTYFIKRHD